MPYSHGDDDQSDGRGGRTLAPHSFEGGCLDGIDASFAALRLGTPALHWQAEWAVERRYEWAQRQTGGGWDDEAVGGGVLGLPARDSVFWEDEVLGSLPRFCGRLHDVHANAVLDEGHPAGARRRTRQDVGVEVHGPSNVPHARFQSRSVRPGESRDLLRVLFKDGDPRDGRRRCVSAAVLCGLSVLLVQLLGVLDSSPKRAELVFRRPDVDHSGVLRLDHVRRARPVEDARVLEHARVQSRDGLDVSAHRGRHLGERGVLGVVGRRLGKVRVLLLHAFALELAHARLAPVLRADERRRQCQYILKRRRRALVCIGNVDGSELVQFRVVALGLLDEVDPRRLGLVDDRVHRSQEDAVVVRVETDHEGLIPRRRAFRGAKIRAINFDDKAGCKHRLGRRESEVGPAAVVLLTFVDSLRALRHVKRDAPRARRNPLILRLAISISIIFIIIACTVKQTQTYKPPSIA